MIETIVRQIEKMEKKHLSFPDSPVIQLIVDVGQYYELTIYWHGYAILYDNIKNENITTIISPNYLNEIKEAICDRLQFLNKDAISKFEQDMKYV